MLTLTLAFRTLTKRRGRMALIGILVAFGTFLLVFGGVVASSVAAASRASIIDNFTGDFIIYSERSKELPSPFAFNTPLPNIRNAQALAEVLKAHPGVAAYAFYAQNYGLLQVEREGKKIDLPFIFYAVEPGPYRSVFSNMEIQSGSYFGLGEKGSSPAPADAAKRGILVSSFQNDQYRENYGVTLRPDEELTLLGITEGGVNTSRSALLGIFEPRRYKSVFNYINFMDAATDSLGSLDLSSLKIEALSGFTMAAVKLVDHGELEAVVADLASREGLGIKIARWDEASGFYAKISSALQAFIFLATALIFLVVVMIFMNTLIINVVERTAEIGTMRAIGADKSFVRGVFLAEALMLNVASALASMAASVVVLAFFGGRGLPLPETVSQFLIGGGPLALRAGAAPFVVRGIYVSDNYFARDLLLSHFDFLRSLDLSGEDSSTSVYVYFPRAEKLRARRDLLAEALRSAGFDVGVPKSDTEAIAAISAASTRYEEDKEGRDRVMLKLATLDEVLGIVRTVLAVSIFINLRMTINERLREIGTMRAMGVDASQVTGLFVIESVALAVIFSAAGSVLSVLFSLAVRYGAAFPPGSDLGIFLSPDLGAFIGVVEEPFRRSKR